MGEIPQPLANIVKNQIKTGHKVKYDEGRENKSESQGSRHRSENARLALVGEHQGEKPREGRKRGENDRAETIPSGKYYCYHLARHLFRPSVDKIQQQQAIIHNYSQKRNHSYYGGKRHGFAAQQNRYDHSRNAERQHTHY